MFYIIGNTISVAPNNHRFVSMGFNPGKSYSIQSIRWNKETKKIEYRITTIDKPLTFNNAAEADAFFDRIKGVVRSTPTTPLEEKTDIYV